METEGHDQEGTTAARRPAFGSPGHVAGSGHSGLFTCSTACPSVSQAECNSPFRVGSVRGRGIDFSFSLELLLTIRGQIDCDMSLSFRGWEHEVLIGSRVCKGDKNLFLWEMEQASHKQTFQISSPLPSQSSYTQAHSHTCVTPPHLAWVTPWAGGRSRGNGHCDSNSWVGMEG